MICINVKTHILIVPHGFNWNFYGTISCDFGINLHVYIPLVVKLIYGTTGGLELVKRAIISIMQKHFKAANIVVAL